MCLCSNLRRGSPSHHCPMEWKKVRSILWLTQNRLSLYHQSRSGAHFQALSLGEQHFLSGGSEELLPSEESTCTRPLCCSVEWGGRLSFRLNSILSKLARALKAREWEGSNLLQWLISRLDVKLCVMFEFRSLHWIPAFPAAVVCYKPQLLTHIRLKLTRPLLCKPYHKPLHRFLAEFPLISAQLESATSVVERSYSLYFYSSTSVATSSKTNYSLHKNDFKASLFSKKN